MDEDLRTLERDALASGLSTDWRRYYAALARAGRGNPSGKARWRIEALSPCQASKLLFSDPRKQGLTSFSMIQAVELEWRRCCSGVPISVLSQGSTCADFSSWRDAIFTQETLTAATRPLQRLGIDLDLLRATLPLTILAPEFLGEPHVLVVREGDPAAPPILIDNPGPVQDTPFGQYHAIGKDTTIRLNPDVLPRVEWVLGVHA